MTKPYVVLNPREVLLLKWAEEANEVAERATALNHAIFKTLRFGENSVDPIDPAQTTNLNTAREATRGMIREMYGLMMSALAFHQYHTEDGETPDEVKFREFIAMALGQRENSEQENFAYAYDAALRAANYIGQQVGISTDTASAERVAGAHFGAIDYLKSEQKEED